MSTREERWAVAERKLDVGYGKRIRRTPGVVIGITALLTLAVGITAAVDLNRLQSPRGASLAWTEAAVFGDCRAYLALSRPVDKATERRSDDEICRALRRKTENARNNSTRITIEAGTAQQTGRTATALVSVEKPEGTVRVELHLVRRADDWLVLRDEVACGQIGCA
jgi:hypothetical protein